MSIMTLYVPPNPRCSCMLAVVGLLKVYFGYMLCDTNTEIHVLGSGIAY